MLLVRYFTTITLPVRHCRDCRSNGDGKESPRQLIWRKWSPMASYNNNQLDEQDTTPSSQTRCCLNLNLYAKYLLKAQVAYCLKKASGASDINKFYGLSAPNFCANQRRSTTHLP
ncbi:hypothetical protein O9929_24755 [Vibrio lentus]|nr:hypothetical protein [Vibrio lentus]